MTRAQIQVLLGLAVVTFGAWYGVAGISVGTAMLAPFSAAVIIQLVAVAIFDRWAWSWPVVHYLADRPRMAGTWRIRGESSYVDEDGETGFDAFYVVRQTFSGISVRFLSRRTTSKSTSAQLVKGLDGEWSLNGTFLDTPARGNAPVHLGAFTLILEGDPVSHFSGQYWTSRSTRGEVRSIGAPISGQYVTFEAAERAFAGAA